MILRRAPEDDDEQVTTFWLITYSDMATLLLAFFLLMFSFTLLTESEGGELLKALNVVTGGESADPRASEDLEAAARKIASQFGGAGQEEAFVESSEDEVTVVLPSGITFGSAEASLSAEAGAALEKVAGMLAAMPNTIRVEGHTDNVPIRGGPHPTNWHLSAARAQSVVRLLIERGVDPRRLQIFGFGESRPRRPNLTEDGRRANRRIEIKLLRSERK
ncbi:MAG: OmpA family protein [Myxococcales bacterium]|nr:OmpA family protein [Myxococcales bacterium]